MKKSQIVISIVLLALMIGYFSTSSSDHRNLTAPGIEAANAAEFLKFEIPAVTHGFEKSERLPDGDIFLLPARTTMAVSDPPTGTQVFPVNFETFGGEGESVGALPGVAPMGLSFSAANSKVQALSCAESIWDGNLLIAATAGAAGDAVRVFLQFPDGQPGPEVALFSIREGGVVVTELHPHLMLFISNRHAKGPGWEKGTYIPFAAAAGSHGYRTDLLTLAWPMKFYSPLQGCYRLGVEIVRGSSEGSTSVVLTDLVVNRNRVPGDENNQGYGLLGRLTGGFPSGLPCTGGCPFPTPDPEPTKVDTCSASCFRSPQYFRLHIDRLPYGTIMVGGLNFNQPISTTDKRTMSLVLRGGRSPLQSLNAEFAAAQLNLLSAGGSGSPAVFSILAGQLKCYRLEFEPITLGNGFVMTPETRLNDLFSQTRLCINANRIEDMPVLAGIFDMLNGNSPLGYCNAPR